ncbi:MAG: hypothetical protein KAY39_01630, partial [Burkholderiaceae bacterium]|nr:hypothetical protein [Burkholderiaceae bacterium]
MAVEWAVATKRWISSQSTFLVSIDSVFAEDWVVRWDQRPLWMAVWVSVAFRPTPVIRGAPKQPFKKMLFGAVIGDWTRRCTNDTFLAAPIKALLG